MLIKVAEKNGYSLWKNLSKDEAVVFDENDNIVHEANAYQASQEYLKLTSNTKG